MRNVRSLNCTRAKPWQTKSLRGCAIEDSCCSAFTTSYMTLAAPSRVIFYSVGRIAHPASVGVSEVSWQVCRGCPGLTFTSGLPRRSRSHQALSAASHPASATHTCVARTVFSIRRSWRVARVAPSPEVFEMSTKDRYHRYVGGRFDLL